MAFTLRPTGAGDFESYREFYPESFLTDAYDVFESLKSRLHIDHPIILDPGKPKTIKIATAFEPAITSEYKKLYPHLSFRWGEGSFGNRGANNRGIAYEKALVQIIDDRLNRNIPCAETALIEMITGILGTATPFRVTQIGGASQITRVPAIIGAGIQLGVGIADIGALIGDIAVSNDHGTVYISVKTTKNYTLTNIGARRFFDKNTQSIFPLGDHLLKMLHIDPTEFLAVFKLYGSGATKPGYTVEPALFPKDEISDFCASCLGFGYIVFCPNHEPTFISREDCINKTRVRAIRTLYPNFGQVKRVITEIEMQNAPTMRVIIRNKDRFVFPNTIEVRAII